MEANRRLALSTLTSEEKQGVCELLEFVLHESGNYAGYNDNYWLTVGYKEWKDAGEPGFPEKELYIYGPKKKSDSRSLPKYDKFSRTYYIK